MLFACTCTFVSYINQIIHFISKRLSQHSRTPRDKITKTNKKQFKGKWKQGEVESKWSLLFSTGESWIWTWKWKESSVLVIRSTREQLNVIHVGLEWEYTVEDSWPALGRVDLVPVRGNLNFSLFGLRKFDENQDFNSFRQSVREESGIGYENVLYLLEIFTLFCQKKQKIGAVISWNMYKFKSKHRI